MAAEHVWYRLVRGTGDAQAEWNGITWHRYAWWMERATRGDKWVEVKKGPFAKLERAREVFVDEVRRKLAEGFAWASKERFGAGPRAAPPEQRTSKPWAKGRARPPAWFAKVPATERARVRAVLERAKLAHRADDILTLARPAIRFSLTTAKAPARVTTRFGGAPDLPRGLPWPTRGTTPLAFVAQFRLDELARLDLERRLPEAGVLSVFAYLALDDSDDYAETGAVLYFADPRALVRTRPPHAADRDERPTKSASAKASLVLTLPALHERAYASLRLTDDEAERYDEQVLPRVRMSRSAPSGPGAHQLLGWSDTLTPSSSEELLGQIDSDRRFGFAVGDVETLRIWIRSTKLLARDFRRARLTVQAD